ncbi:unnamed protein product [Cuscuta campestris]|uniref:Ubiquitin-like protease family profile domain-containing protein n=1 Tax=Cuscuta campestris TaxID=132261 RepID=A0A484LWG4_9ASTE|nr:unnamed protein product [Cuscuta campestris]
MRTKNASVSSSMNGNDEYHAEERMKEHNGSPKPTQGTFEKDAPVPKWILATVANSDDSMSFPWGTWAFQESLRIQSLGKDLVSEKKKLVKGGKTSNTLRYTGFVLPSSFLLFECINDFGETFGVKMEQTNPALPRMWVDHNEDGKEDEKVDPPCFEWVNHKEDAIKDGREEEPMGENKVDPYSFDGVDHNEEEKNDWKEEDGKEGDGKEEDEPIADNMVKLSSFEGIPEEKDEEEVDQFKVKNRSPPIQEEEEEKLAVEGEANENEMAMSDKIVHDVVEFCKSTENNVDKKVEFDVDVLRELTDVDEVAVARELGRGLWEKKRSIHISSPYFSNVLKKVKVINSDVSNELDKAEEEQLNIRMNPSSQQLEAFHQFMQSAIADGREVQCIMEKRGESHGIVKKWWSSLMESGGWLETTHMEEIMIYFMKMYNKKDSTYAVLPETFQMLGEVNATTELFPILDTGLTQIVLGTWDSCSKPWKDISCVYWVHNIKNHWVAIRADFHRKCLVVFDSLQRITSMSKLEEELSNMLKIFPVICQYASNYLQGIPGDHRDMTVKWSVERPLVPQQTNSDCGVFALKFIELGVQNLHPPVLSGFSEHDIVQLRTSYAYAICREKF